AAKSGRELRVMKDDIDQQLLPIFLEEAEALVPQIGSDLRDWKANPTDERISQSLRRGLHTLKGSARMAGAIRLGELTHIIESRIDAAIETNQFTAELFAEVEEKMDRVTIDLERMTSGTPEAAPPAVAEAAAPVAAAAALQPEAVAAAATPARPAAPKAEAPL